MKNYRNTEIKSANCKATSENELGASMYRKHQELIQMLLIRTDAGDLGWKSAGGDTFVAKLGDHGVAIAEEWGTGTGSTQQVVLRLCNRDGDYIDQILEEDLDEVPNARTQLEHLFAAARRRAMGADHAIDNMLEFLAENVGSKR